MYELGDIVLVKGQRSFFFEVIEVEDKRIWVSDGYVQITRLFSDVELICKAKSRQDAKVPKVYFPK